MAPPNDIPDWTDESIISGAVNVTAGSVAISAGQSGTNVSMDTPPALLGTITMPAGNTNTNQNFTLPANATGIAVYLSAQGGRGVVTPHIVLAGGVTGKIYATVVSTNLVGPNDGLLAFAPIGGAADNPLNVNVNWDNFGGSGGVVCAYVYAFLGTGVQQVYADRTEPLAVNQFMPNYQAVTNVQNVSVANGGAIIAAPANNVRIVVIGIWVRAVAADSCTVGSGAFACNIDYAGGFHQGAVVFPIPEPCSPGQALVYGANTVNQNAIFTVSYYTENVI